jgi:hypothetical protein
MLELTLPSPSSLLPPTLRHNDVFDYLLEALRLLLVLSIDEANSLYIGENAMHVLAKLMELHPSEAVLLSEILKLQEQLAFEEDNILCIVQYGGIEGILSSMKQNSTNEELVTRSLKLLENIFLGSKMYAAVAWELGCEAVVKEVWRTHEDNDEVIAAARGALLHLDISSRDKQTERNEAEKKKAEAEKRKQRKMRAAVGSAKQARMLKMMSLRDDVEDAEPVSARGNAEEREAALRQGGSSRRMKAQLRADPSELRSGDQKRSGRTAAPGRNLDAVEGGANPLARDLTHSEPAVPAMSSREKAAALRNKGAPIGPTKGGRPSAAGADGFAFKRPAKKANDISEFGEDDEGGSDGGGSGSGDDAAVAPRKGSKAAALGGKMTSSFRKMFGKKK